jgi:uncharacterized membrane protein YtjA (UPF0391 family)
VHVTFGIPMAYVLVSFVQKGDAEGRRKPFQTHLLRGEPVGKLLNVYVVTAFLILVSTAVAAFDFVDFASISAGLAKVFFIVVPVVFVVSTALGLAARRRA